MHIQISVYLYMPGRNEILFFNGVLGPRKILVSILLEFKKKKNITSFILFLILIKKKNVLIRTFLFKLRNFYERKIIFNLRKKCK